jgi:uncharacterized membrane protein
MTSAGLKHRHTAERERFTTRKRSNFRQLLPLKVFLRETVAIILVMRTRMGEIIATFGFLSLRVSSEAGGKKFV